MIGARCHCRSMLCPQCGTKEVVRILGDQESFKRRILKHVPEEDLKRAKRKAIDSLIAGKWKR